MRKKQRRKQTPRRFESTASATSGAGGGGAAAVRIETRQSPPVAVRARPAASWSEFSSQYAHVTGELKQIGILAGSFLLVLVILAAVLN